MLRMTCLLGCDSYISEKLCQMDFYKLNPISLLTDLIIDLSERVYWKAGVIK